MFLKRTKKPPISIKNSNPERVTKIQTESVPANRSESGSTNYGESVSKTIPVTESETLAETMTESVNALPLKRRKNGLETVTESSMHSLDYQGTAGLTKVYSEASAERTEDPARDSDAFSQALDNIKISRQIQKGELSAEFYRGQKGYALYAEKSAKDIACAKRTGALGPVRAPTNIRNTCRFDYSYGLCKDWKISGYCGYGDNCIFVHDRSEFKTGWELEREWEEQQAEKRKRAFEKLEDPTTNNTTEPECEICNGKLTEPVITLCEHSFCLNCAMNNFSKSKKCFTCGKNTHGIFNSLERESK